MKKFLIGLALSLSFAGNSFAEDIWADTAPLPNDWGTLPNDWGTLSNDWGTARDWDKASTEWEKPTRDWDKAETNWDNSQKWEPTPLQDYPKESAEVATEETPTTEPVETEEATQQETAIETVPQEAEVAEAPVEETVQPVVAEPAEEPAAQTTEETVAEVSTEQTAEAADSSQVAADSTSKPAEQVVAAPKEDPAALAAADHNWVETKQESATEAAKDATNKDSGKKIHWVPVSISAGVAIAGGALAYYFDSQAKKATQTAPTNHTEYQKGYDDAGKNQMLRTISIGVAGLGLVGIGVSFIF